MDRRTLLLTALVAPGAQMPGVHRAHRAPGGHRVRQAFGDAVRDAEQQFAATMARRDFGGFPNYISEEGDLSLVANAIVRLFVDGRLLLPRGRRFSTVQPPRLRGRQISPKCSTPVAWPFQAVR